MNFEQARYILLIHGSGTFDASGEPVVVADGFHGMLRPYQGLRENNFHLVMEALLVVGSRLHSAATVDRELIESLWSTCSLMRRNGLHPEGNLQSNNLITADDTKRLKAWINTFESSALELLRGYPPHVVIIKYALYIIDYGPGKNIVFFIPLMGRCLDDPDQFDPTAIAEALGKLGPIASDILPALHAASQRTYPDYCHLETHAKILYAIRQIETAEHEAE